MPGTSQAARDQGIAIRVILLALLLAAADLWALRHLGFGLEDPVGLLGLTGGLTVFSFVLDYFIDEAEQKKLARPFQQRLQKFLRRWILATPTLVVLYLLCGVAASMFSSITVVGAATGDPVQVTIEALDDKTAALAESVAATAATGPLPFRANPFGRDLRISPQGYSAQTRTLYPLSGLTVSLDDFAPLPTLLLRPDGETLSGVLNGALYIVWKRDAKGGCTELGKGEIAAAAMVGVRRAIPSDLPTMWRLELQSKNVDDISSAKTLLAWQRAQPLATAQFIEAGDMLRVEVRQNDNLVGFADYTVTNEPFQDVPLADAQGSEKACS